MSTVPNGAYVSQASALRVARREFEPGPIVRVRFYSHTWHGRPRWGYVREGSVFDQELTRTQTIDGRDYDIYYDGDRVRMVAWHDDDGNSYWVSNTLLQTLDESQMLAIATTTKEIK